MLGRAEVPVDAVSTTEKSFELPELFDGGAPVYSHVVLYGDCDGLSREDLEKLGRYADGTIDPMYSR